MKNKKMIIALVLLLAIAGIVLGLRSMNDDNAENALTLDLFFFNDTSSSLVAENQKIKYSADEDIREKIIDAIIKGSSNSKNVKIVDKNTKLNSIEKKSQGIVVDFSSEFLSGDQTKNVLAAYAIVKTLCQIPGVTSVKVTVNSQELIGPDGNRLGFLSGEDINLEKDINNSEIKYVVLYFADSKTSELVKEVRTIKITDTQPIEKYIINELIKGPANSSLQAVLSPDTSVISVQTTDGTCFINFNSNFVSRNSGTTEKENLAIYSIVNSLTELEHVNNVQFLVDGKKISSFGKNSISGTFYRNKGLIRRD